jgi:outer membrane protein insertion porin family
VGGSVRLGRPLPWPDYSRGSVSYRLEDVTIDGELQGTQDSIAFAGQPLGQAVRTSSLETGFNRNSTNNPFYPTKGTRLDVSDEFAGGPFGGRVDFHKHRIEGRLYFPSPLKGVTTMVRARLGLLAGYAGQNSAVPAYERFRLGGGSTADPLRGYDDYQVVPGKYDRLLPNVVRRAVYDTTGTVIDTTFVSDTTGFSRIRYPGGRFMSVFTLEQQFPIVHPLHAVLFFDAGNTWDQWREIKPFDLKMGAGLGLRMEIPLLGNIGLDYGYGFNRDDGPRAKAHFLLGSFSF